MVPDTNLVFTELVSGTLFLLESENKESRLFSRIYKMKKHSESGVGSR